MKQTENKIWDIIVIGGGPAGMMAAGRAGENNKNVLLLEKNTSLGKKLLITGGGRCNLTNNKTDNRILLAKYKDSGKFLFSPFSQFSVADTLKFFNDRGVETKEENDGRIFPVSNKAESVFDTLIKYMKDNKVEIKTGTTVKDISKKEGLFIIKTNTGEICAKSCVLATGGTSHPETGSTGEGFTWLKKLGHQIADNTGALVPVAIKDTWVKKLSGVTLENVKVTTYQVHYDREEKQDSQKGKILFTHFGLSGPMVLNMSKGIGESLQYGEVKIILDLFPELDERELRETLQETLVKYSNKKLKNALEAIIPTALIDDLLLLAKIKGETFTHSVKSEDRITLARQFKTITLNVKGLLGKDKAIVSSGGVNLTEIDTKTMESKIVKNLYLVGDVLDIDRPSGGYSLQLCFTTGHVAGKNA